MYSTPMHLIRPCQHTPHTIASHASLHTHTPMHLCTEYGLCSCCHRCASTYVLACDFWRLLPCIFAQSMVDACVAIDVLAPMCWHVISGACVLGHAFARSPTDMRACANVCARVPMHVLGPMSWHASNTRTHTADVLADFCDGDVAPCSRKRSRRLPHAHVCQVVSYITSDMPRASQPEALTARSTS